MPDKLLTIYMTRYILSIYESELSGLLKDKPDLWAACIKRGKGASRLEKAMERKAGKVK